MQPSRFVPVLTLVAEQLADRHGATTYPGSGIRTATLEPTTETGATDMVSRSATFSVP